MERSRSRLYVAALIAWFGLFALAFLNGALRKLVFEPWLGESAHPASGITGIILLGSAAALFARWVRPGMVDALAIGAIWFGLALAAEVLLTLYAGRPASEVADAFTFASIARGDLLAPMLLWMAAVPAAMALAGPRK